MGGMPRTVMGQVNKQRGSCMHVLLCGSAIETCASMKSRYHKRKTVRIVHWITVIVVGSS